MSVDNNILSDDNVSNLIMRENCDDSAAYIGCVMNVLANDACAVVISKHTSKIVLSILAKESSVWKIAQQC